MTKIVTFSIPDDVKQLLDKFKDLCRKEGKPFSRKITELIEDYVKRHGEGNPAIPLDKWVETKDFIACPTLGEPPWKYNLEEFPDDVLGIIVYHAKLWYEAANDERLKRQEKRRLKYLYE